MNARIAALLSQTVLSAALFASVLGLATPARAQSIDAINAQMNAFNARLAANQQRINGWVRQRMQNPQVQAAYARYAANARANGQAPQSFSTYAYYWIATNGYSRSGVNLLRQNDARNAQAERAALADERAAEANRGAAQLAGQQHFSQNSAEVGNMLRGTSTYTAENGAQRVLPHTWQANTTHGYEGNLYYVDASGNYWVAGGNGGWYPLHR
jgi:hypothetical protein